PSWLTCLMLGYLAVMILMATRLSTEIVRLQRLIARANETEAAAELNWRDARSLFRRKVHLLASTGIAAPMSAGLWRPVILVPAGLIEVLRPEELKAVLGHEMAHHRRGDLWINALQAVLAVVWWFHPIYWLLN